MLEVLILGLVELISSIYTIDEYGNRHVLILGLVELISS